MTIPNAVQVRCRCLLTHGRTRQSVPGEVLGRVNAAMQMLNRGLLPIGSLGAGILGEMIGLRPTLAVGAAGLLLSSLWLVLSPIRTMRDYPPHENRSIAHQIPDV